MEDKIKFKYLESALKIGELASVIANVSCNDKKDMTSYSIYMVLFNAKYVLSCYRGQNGYPKGDHMLHQDLTGEYGKLAKRLAISEVKKLEKFIERCDKIIARRVKSFGHCGYNYEKDICDRCGIDKEEAKKHPVSTGIDHPEYRYSTSFSLSTDGTVKCAKCHREEELEKLFNTMDAIDAKRASEGRGPIPYIGENRVNKR